MAGQNGSNGISPSIKNLPEVKQILDQTQSLDEIVSGFSTGAFEQPIPQIPLGDDPVVEPAFNAPSPEQILQELNTLESEIQDAQLEGAKSQQSLSSFEGLKTRYTNKIGELKGLLNIVTTEKTALAEQLSKATQFQKDAESYQEAVPQLEDLKEQVRFLTEENKTLNHFRKKYDLENDPQIKRDYTEPMTEYKSRSLDIIKNSGRDQNLWNELLKADSEFKVNSLIDNNGFTGMNAQALKSYTAKYKALDNEFQDVADPEHIDSAIALAKGKTKEVSKEQAAKIFKSLKSQFSDHVSELKESEANKEHNLFVHDTVVAQAEKNFDNLRTALGPQFQNAGVLGMIAQAALMSAAYPAQDRLAKYLLKQNKSLISELAEIKGGTSIRQTRERVSPTFSGEWQDVKKASTESIDDIVNSVRK